MRKYALISLVILGFVSTVSAGSFTIDSDSEWRNNGTLKNATAVASELYVGEGDNFEDGVFDWKILNEDGAWEEKNGHLVHNSSGTGGAKAQDDDYNISAGTDFGFKYEGWVNGGGNHIFITPWNVSSNDVYGDEGVYEGFYPGGNELRIDDRSDGNSNKATTSVSLSDQTWYDLRGYMNVSARDTQLNIDSDDDGVYDAKVRNSSLVYSMDRPAQFSTWLAPDSKWEYYQVYSLYPQAEFESDPINDGNTNVKNWDSDSFTVSKIDSSDSYNLEYYVSNSTSGFSKCSTGSDITSCDDSEYIKFVLNLNPAREASTPKIDSQSISYTDLGYNDSGGSDTALDLTLDEPQNKTYEQDYVWVNGSTNEEANVTYTVDGGSEQSLGDQVNSFSEKVTRLSDGNHSIKVDGVDSSDGTDTDSQYREFNINTGSPSANLPIDEGLKLHYRLNDTSDDNIIQDWSGLENDGTASSSLDFGVEGVVNSGDQWGTGEAVEFDNSDQDNINVSNIDFKNNEFTVSTWINPEGDLDQETKLIVGTDSEDSYTYYLQLNGGACTNTCYLGGFKDSSNNFNVASSDVSELDSGWQMLTASYNGSTLSLYQNTTLLDSTTVSSQLENTTSIGLGYDPADLDSSEYFNGSMDEPKVYNRSLNSSEIEDVFYYNRESEESISESQPQIEVNQYSDGKYFNSNQRDVNIDWTSSTNSSRELVSTEIYSNISGSWESENSYSLTGTEETESYTFTNVNSPQTVKYGLKTEDNVSSTSLNKTFTVRFYKKWAPFSDTHYGNDEGDTAYEDNKMFNAWAKGYNPDICTFYGDITSESAEVEWDSAYGNFTQIIEETDCTDIWTTPGASHDGYSDKTEGGSSPNLGDYGWNGIAQMIRRQNQTSHSYTVTEGNMAFLNVRTVSQNSTSMANVEVGTGPNNQYGFIPKQDRDYLDNQLDYLCQNNYNIIVGTHRPLYHTNILTDSWYGMSQPSWQNTTADTLDIMRNADCQPDMFLNGHVHRNSNDYDSDGSSEVQGGTFVWGSNGRAELPDETVFGMIQIVNDAHGGGASEDNNFVGAHYANLTEGNDYIRLHSVNVEDNSSVGFTYNDTSSTIPTVKIPLNHEISFDKSTNGNEMDTWNQSFSIWDSPALTADNGENQLFRPSEGQYFDESWTWAEYRFKFNEERSFEGFNVDWKESSSGCCNLSYEVSSADSLKGTYSKWYNDPSDAPAGQYWRVNITLETNSYVVIQDMQFSENDNSITIESPENKTYSTDSVDLNVTSSDPVDTWKYDLDGQGNTTFTPNTTLTNLSGGEHSLDVWAEFSDGNVSRESVSFSVFSTENNKSLVEGCSSSPFCYTGDNGTEKNNPVSVSGSLVEGESRTFTWQVNATGSPGDYNFFGFYNSTVSRFSETFTSIKTLTLEGENSGTGNSAPTADFTTSATDLTVSVDASGSSDSDGTISAYRWDWTSDGTFEDTGQTSSHTYPSEGDYTITLEVEDDDGATSQTSTTVSLVNDTSESDDGDGSTGGGGGGDTTNDTDETDTGTVDGTTATLYAPRNTARYGGGIKTAAENGFATFLVGGEERSIKVVEVYSQEKARIATFEDGTKEEQNVTESETFTMTGGPGIVNLGKDIHVMEVIKRQDSGGYISFSLDDEGPVKVPFTFGYTVNESAEFEIQYAKTGPNSQWKSAGSLSVSQSSNYSIGFINESLETGIYQRRLVINSSDNSTMTEPAGFTVGQAPSIEITNPNNGEVITRPNTASFEIPLDYRFHAFENNNVSTESIGQYYVGPNGEKYSSTTNFNIESDSQLDIIGRIVKFTKDPTYTAWSFIQPVEATYTVNSQMEVTGGTGSYTGYANATLNTTDGKFTNLNSFPRNIQVNPQTWEEYTESNKESEVITETDSKVVNQSFEVDQDGDGSKETVTVGTLKTTPDLPAEDENVVLDDFENDEVRIRFFSGNSEGTALLNRSFVLTQNDEKVFETGLPVKPIEFDFAVNASQVGNWSEGNASYYIKYYEPGTDDSLLYSSNESENGTREFQIKKAGFKDLASRWLAPVTGGFTTVYDFTEQRALFLVALVTTAGWYILFKSRKQDFIGKAGAAAWFAGFWWYGAIPAGVQALVIGLAAITLTVKLLRGEVTL